MRPAKLATAFITGVAALLGQSVCPEALASQTQLGGHVKLSHSVTGYPQDSADASPQLYDTTSVNLSTIDLRGKLHKKQGAWDLQMDYQFSGLHSHQTDYFESNLGPLLNSGGIGEDDARVFDLNHQQREADHVLVHRLDRLNVGYTAEAAVVRLGRQAVSWGNGLVFNPMDIFNPFDPAAVDKEYKTGDDMVYAQWLLESGNDWQLVMVPRREASTGKLSESVSSLALKYHALTDKYEYDLLLAQHYDDTVLGIGLVSHLGDAITRGDITWVQTDTDWVASAVASVSYSWVLAGRNWSGSAELYYNGYGLDKSTISTIDLIVDTQLTDRIVRGELYSLGRYYAALVANVEMSPRMILTPSLFMNVRDQSGLVQLSANYDWLQNADLVVSVNLPFGADGTENGGIALTDTNTEPTYLASDYHLLAQLSIYF
ncbi:hypothetical protein [Arenicella chitinivorans]|nr:hypothetical protein [Arenicella chitinivorans]